VKRVSIASVVPFSPSGTGASQEVFFAGDSAIATEGGHRLGFNAVDPDYLDLLGIRVLRGRGFAVHDDRPGPRVMLINEAMARSFWPKGDPVGRFVRLGTPTGQLVEIVGIVRDTKLNSIEETPAPYLYLPLGQCLGREAYLLAESSSEAAFLAGAVRAELGALGLKPSRSDISTMKGFIRARLSGEEFLARVAALLGLLGLALASIGLYGVLSYSVSRRTQEIGVRMALEAQRREVLGMILRQGLVLALLGLALGAPLALAVGYLCRSLVYGVRPLDLVSLGLSAVLLLAVAGLAAYFPARRATKVDPLSALRYE